MKHNWTYKKLGEVADVVMGQSPDGSSLNDSKGIEFHQGKVAFGEKFLKPSHCYTTAPTKLAKGHSLLLCVRAPVGILNITDREICIGRGLCAVNAKDDAINEFLYYALRSKQEYFEKNSTGSTFKAISSALVKGALIPCPSLDEQQAIVRELDGINHLINLQEEQLREYDRLAQSLFYTTFGDPATNPKGWSLAEFSTLCDNLTKGPFGSDIKKSLFVPKSKDTYKVYIQANAIQKDISLGDYYISKEYFEEKMRRFELHSGDYIITCDGTLGKFVRMTPNMERGIISASLLKLTLNELITSSYFESIWNNYLLDKLVHQTRNAALVHLPSATNIGKELIPLPPLALQQTFAAQIEVIEQQKALIRKSLEDTRTLLAARMQYYFE